MTLAPPPTQSRCQARFAAPPEMFFLAPFAGFRLLGYCVAGVVLDWIDSARPPLERTPGPMSQMRETAR